MILTQDEVRALHYRQRLRELMRVKRQFIESFQVYSELMDEYFDSQIRTALTLPAITDQEIYLLMRIGYIQGVQLQQLAVFRTCLDRQNWSGRKIALKLVESELVDAADTT